MEVTSVDPWSFRVIHGLEVSLEALQTLAPEPPIRLDPRIDLLEPLRTKSVHASLGIDADVDETCLTQHPEVLRDGWLAHREPVHELTHRSLAVSQEVEDATAGRFGEELEGGDHLPSMPLWLYACQVM
jgi:hypothetical protein